MADCDWKKELNELGDMMEAEYNRHKEAVKEIEAKAKIVIEKGGKDAQKHWDSMMARFKEIGKEINWVENRYIYIAVGVIIGGLIAHYVFGI